MRFLCTIFVIAGGIFRLLWPMDMEWKADEKTMYEMAQKSVETATLPALGMPSGAGLINSGLSVWPFAFFYSISADPVHMTQFVQWVNVFAVLVFLLCTHKIPMKFHEDFLIGITSFSVALIPVLFSRKLWAQDLIPLFIACAWYFYLQKKRPYLLPLSGVFAACTAQIHLSGFYYAAGILFAALILKQFRVKEAVYFCAGFLVGLVPAWPWFAEILHHHSGIASLSHLLKFEFWLHALIDPLGINAYYSLGSSTMDFARFPANTYLAAMLTFFIAGLVLVSIWFHTRKPGNLKGLLNREDPYLFCLLAFVLIPGILMTVSAIPVRSHYLIGALPFLHIGLLRILRVVGNRWRLAFILAQACITFLFLAFIHQRQEINGDYGKTYRAQVEATK